MNKGPSATVTVISSLLLAACLAGLPLVACEPASTPTQLAAANPTAAAATAARPTATMPLATLPTPPTAEPGQEPARFPLGEPGPYHAGNLKVTFVDESRDGREVEVLIWYPAVEQTDEEGKLIVRGAQPDLAAHPIRWSSPRRTRAGTSSCRT